MANEALIPWYSAESGRKVKGRKSPKNAMKAAQAVSRKGISLKGLRNSMRDHGLGEGGRRDRTVQLANISRPRIRNAAALIAYKLVRLS